MSSKNDYKWIKFRGVLMKQHIYLLLIVRLCWNPLFNITLFRHTFEVAPFFTLVEHSVLAHLRRFIGWSDGDGIFSPGMNFSKFLNTLTVYNPEKFTYKAAFLLMQSFNKNS